MVSIRLMSEVIIARISFPLLSFCCLVFDLLSTISSCSAAILHNLKNSKESQDEVSKAAFAIISQKKVRIFALETTQWNCLYPEYSQKVFVFNWVLKTSPERNSTTFQELARVTERLESGDS